MVPVGSKIRMLRQKSKLTQAELAAKLGISQAEVSRMERGRTAVTVQDLYKISSALDVPVTALLDEADFHKA
ncbi:MULTISPECIES: helix-turn-helix domain-containing protein [Desulfofundulus]|uniref:XRE family transcriptional regulator n=1 Tax=Desulfofundulus salinus TaxID=2419843 RepID=A0A494WZI7_9FIRM|nr:MULTISPECIES: helix-turn-helix transcriptional regulator [Desulfofundulus]RKO66357.1 XRE family transcriptional regulator [Desulfofundulus salinum]